ncbi:helix-turn-helix domain-containing protein [uncultured Alistipes sp.]|uniref:helix-turn-helix domain-containing protein n=2 Tax=uncultured Alistipes sp. TaxID=538949 RepID=UPI00343590DC
MTNLTSMMESGANIIVAIALEDLRRFHKEVIADTKKELEAQIAEDKGERYLSIKQVCEMLDVDPSTLWRWRKRGYLVPAEVGRRPRYRLSDVRRMLNNGRAAQ